MIAANELRIGNLIKDNDCEPYYFTVEELRRYVGFDVWIYYRKGSIKSKEVEPIPLTEEWLLRFGFELGINSKHWFILSPKIYFYLKNGKDIDETLKGKFYYESTLTEIKYVHQLQNLYFALTGEELKITLDKQK